VSEIAHRHGALFHTDAVQGITYMNIPANVVDMMSLSGHKYGAPKRIGALYINPFIIPEIKGYGLISGGKQEFGLRAGTENIPYIVGFAQATIDLVKNKEEKIKKETYLHDYLISKLKQNFPYIKINGYESAKYKNPGILNFSLGFADAASVVEWMNIYEICISSGSACNTGSIHPSHVLTAMGMDEQRAFSSIRVSLSEMNTEEEIDRFIEVLKDFENIYKH
jgi:cysteine desulfurase